MKTTNLTLLQKSPTHRWRCAPTRQSRSHHFPICHKRHRENPSTGQHLPCSSRFLVEEMDNRQRSIKKVLELGSEIMVGQSVKGKYNVTIFKTSWSPMINQTSLLPSQLGYAPKTSPCVVQRISFACLEGFRETWYSKMDQFVLVKSPRYEHSWNMHVHILLSYHGCFIWRRSSWRKKAPCTASGSTNITGLEVKWNDASENTSANCITLKLVSGLRESELRLEKQDLPRATTGKYTSTHW